MRYSVKRALMLPILAFALSGCDVLVGAGYDDLYAFFEREQKRTPPTVKPLPKVKTYAAYDYSASGLRAPFTPMVRFEQEEISGQAVYPDIDRSKEHLEQFALETIKMVGTLSNEGGVFALVRAPDSVHRVGIGNYMGRNHGKVIAIDEVSVKLVEIVPAGAGRWIERPRAIDLQE